MEPGVDWGGAADAFIKIFREIGIPAVLIVVIFLQAWRDRRKD